MFAVNWEPRNLPTPAETAGIGTPGPGSSGSKASAFSVVAISSKGTQMRTGANLALTHSVLG